MVKRILLVEDDEAIQDSLKELLEDAGYTVRAAGNGLEALNVLHSERPHPCLILLDLMMPLMDGYKFREVQKSDPQIANIPIVILTADGQIEAKKNRIGAHGYVKKPIEIRGFLAEIKRFCG